MPKQRERAELAPGGHLIRSLGPSSFFSPPFLYLHLERNCFDVVDVARGCEFIFDQPALLHLEIRIHQRIARVDFVDKIVLGIDQLGGVVAENNIRDLIENK